MRACSVPWRLHFGLWRPILLCAALSGCGASVAQTITLEQAIASALASNANILVARSQLAATEATIQQQRGAFDTTLSVDGSRSRAVVPLRAGDQAALAAAGVNLQAQQSDAAQARVALNHTFPNGMQAGLSATHNHLLDNTQTAGGVPAQSTGVIAFQLRVPLMRNGALATGAPLRAAQMEAEASRYELAQVASQTALGAALAYWDYLGKLERLAIARSGEQRGEGLLEELRKLVAADEVPRAELQLAQASLTERRSARIGAEQSVLEARRNLGRLLGLPAAEMMALGAPETRFPQVPAESNAPPKAASVLQLAARAVQARPDMLALLKRRDVARLRMEAAQHQEKPQLDLVLGATRNGLAEGARPWDAGASFSGGAAPGLSVGLNYQLVLGGNTAEGTTRLLAESVTALDIRSRELGYAVESAVETAAWAVNRAALQVTEAEKAVATYASSLDNERIKRRMGIATLIEVLNVEDRYNAALLAAVQARQGYASAIAQFRYEAALLVTPTGDGYQARLQDLMQPPAEMRN
jgi:outer membrane protein TolC